MHIIIAIIMVIMTPFEIIYEEYAMAFFTGSIGILTILFGLIFDLGWDLIGCVLGCLLGFWNPFGFENKTTKQFDLVRQEITQQCKESVRLFPQNSFVKIKGFSQKLKVISSDDCENDTDRNSITLINELGQTNKAEISQIEKF
jgi:hypothetical protein